MNQPEPTVGCRGCGALVLVTLKDKHRDVCPAALKNSLYQYRQTHGGDHVKLDDAIRRLDESIESIDEDTADLFKRIELIEQRPVTEAAAAPEGVQISGWLDDTDQPTDDTEPAADIEPQQVDGFAPFPTAEPPAYTTATNPGDVDDFEARIIAAQTGGIVR